MLNNSISLKSYWLSIAVLISALVFSSVGNVQRIGEIIVPTLLPTLNPSAEYWGIVAVLLYIIGGVFALFLALRWLIPWCLKWITKDTCIFLFIFTLICLVVLYAWIYPLSTSGVLGGGSDRDEALNIAVTELINGRYPYYPKTYVPGLPHELALDGNPISPLPGELIFALPFVLLGNGTYQTFFWLVVLFWVVGWYFNDLRQGLFYVWIIMIFAPVGLIEIVTGGDLLANNIWVMVLSLFLLYGDMNFGMRKVIAVVLGIGLSSRPNFILLLPMLAAVLAGYYGVQNAFKLVAITLIACVAVTMPFYLYDPGGFSPLHTYNKLGQFDDIFPHAGSLIPFIAGITSCVAAVYYLLRKDDQIFFYGIALVQAVPVVMAVILSSLNKGHLELMHYTFYGQNFLLFATLGAWRVISGNFAGNLGKTYCAN